MHCPFTSVISVKREHGILIPVYALFLLFNVRDSCVGPPPPPFTALTVTQDDVKS